MTATLVHMIPVGATIRHAGARFRLVRHHTAPKGKVAVEVENLDRGGYAMAVLADTDRLDVEETT